MKLSPLIKKAKTFIQSVKGQMLSVKQRSEQAILLAGCMMDEAHRIQTVREKRQQNQLAGMMQDPMGKVFVTALTDQCFRSNSPKRIANQLCYVINTMGIPSYLPSHRKAGLKVFALTGQLFAHLAVPLTVHMIRKETHNVILPGEHQKLRLHMKKRYKENVRINLNHLGEAILGEKEALHRLNIYLEDLAKPEVEYISVKISTIYSQINLLAWEDTLEIIKQRLRLLYQTAQEHQYHKPDGQKTAKFVNLDMEEYRDLHLTVEAFCQVLSEPIFQHYQAGIVLQSYLPDSFVLQQKLTTWAMERVSKGGSPIKIRIVKGANLAMEQFEAAVRLWPQAPYRRKKDTDANYKRMLTYGCQKEHAKAAHLGIGSHNIFDIAYALLLRSEQEIEPYVCFEMLEGMADHMRRVVQQLSGDMLLYCPSATKEEFQNAIAYLVRRLDENTAPENFLRHAFDLTPGTPNWDKQAILFQQACLAKDSVSIHPQRTQNRLKNAALFFQENFYNVADTDWALPQNRIWANQIVNKWQDREYAPIPLVIADQEIHTKQVGKGKDPSRPGLTLYTHALAESLHIDQALQAAQQATKTWQQTSYTERAELLQRIAQEMHKNRSELMGAMIANTGKTIVEADVEISEAIDFANYYAYNLMAWHELSDISWQAKGIILVASPWNFPCSIPAGGILAALATGNCVIFKPAKEAILVGWELVKLFWQAGVSRQVLQFIVCEDEPIGSQLLQDARINAVILTGATATAQLFLKLRPTLDLMAETGGKNIMVISSLSDRDLAIKDLIQSAFGHAGQKCSACSLAILEAEVYDDEHFLAQLKDAAASLSVGSAWDFKTKINPLIDTPNPNLAKALVELEEGEEWLLKPVCDPENPNLWSPGIKLGVKLGSFTFNTELFGPVLGLVRAKDLPAAFHMMNQTPYGLTAGIHSLDEREQEQWLQAVEAGNCYINRTITGAIVERQPFGGCKASSFGKGAKAGGPNYLIQFMQAKQTQLPVENSAYSSPFLSKEVEKLLLFSPAEKTTWEASVQSYLFHWHTYFSQMHDYSLVLGQDNLHRYLAHPKIILRIHTQDTLLDIARVIAAASICQTSLELSIEKGMRLDFLKKNAVFSLPFIEESHQDFAFRMQKTTNNRLRFLSSPPVEVYEILAPLGLHVHVQHVLANGRIELLNYVREVSISRDYHRYGNLGLRENDKRAALIEEEQEQTDLIVHEV